MNEKGLIRIAVGMDKGAWHEKFARALAAKVEQGYPLEYVVVNLGRNDWLEKIAPNLGIAFERG